MNGEVARVRKRGAKGVRDKLVESSDEEIDPYSDRRATRLNDEHVKRVKRLSSLESEEEDVFHLKSHPIKDETEIGTASEDQAERFAKHQEYLEKLRESRMEALQSQQEDEEEEVSKAQEHTSSNEELITSEQFNLMQKTAQALRGAGNRSILEARILANHGNDARFAFLRKQADGNSQSPGRLYRTWQALKEGKNITLEAVNSDTNASLNTLVAYESSEEEDDDPETEGQTGQPTKTSENSLPIAEEDAETKRKRRLQLAHEWSKKKQEERAKKEAKDISTSTSHTHST